MAAASLGIPRTIFFPTSTRFCLRVNKPRPFAFSSFAAPGRSSTVKGATVKVSSEYRDYEAATKFPRPETVPWQKELANTVHLIGQVGKPVEIRQTQTGKAFAWTRLGVKLSPKSTETAWFQLKFWQEMAEIAAEHLKERDQVYVSGYLNIDEVTDRDNNLRTYFQVVVSTLNFVERESSFSPHENVNMNSSISGLVQEDVNMKPAISGSSKAPTNALGTEKLWQAFFVNPTEWWDNRKNKRNPRAPDFKHKTTGEVLWIEGYSNPSWVKSQLDKLDEVMESSKQFTKPHQSLSSFEDRDFRLF